jgi:hypothetical protein
VNAQARERAAGVLGLPPDARAADAAGAFLAALPRAEFVPGGDAVAALNVLARVSAPRDADGETEPGLTLADEVEDFARRFWSLAPAERLAEWVALGERAPDEAVTARLLALQPGLEVATHVLSDPDSEEVAVFARELFLLQPRGRAVRRNEWLLANAARHEELSRAADRIRKLRPDVVALDPHLFARLSAQFDAAAFASAANAEPLGGAQLVEIRLAEPSSVEKRVAEAAKAPVQSAIGWGGSWIFIVGLIMLVRMCAAVTRPDSDRPNPSVRPPEWKYPAPNPSFEQHPKQTVPFRVMRFTPSQVQSFEEFDSRQKGIAPAWYAEWVVAGRPGPNTAVIVSSESGGGSGKGP